MAKGKKKVGRPCKLTPEVHGKIVAGIRLGSFAWVAAQAAGISPRTFHSWMQLGEEGDPEFLQFMHDVREAGASARQDAEWAVKKHKPIDWLRLGPGRDKGSAEPGWTDRTEVSGPGGGPIQVEGTVVVTTPDEKEYVAKLKSVRGEK